jgi:hypothetical protein
MGIPLRKPKKAEVESQSVAKTEFISTCRHPLDWSLPYRCTVLGFEIQVQTVGEDPYTEHSPERSDNETLHLLIMKRCALHSRR